jgi:hypothetical protein
MSVMLGNLTDIGDFSASKEQNRSIQRPTKTVCDFVEVLHKLFHGQFKKGSG